MRTFSKPPKTPKPKPTISNSDYDQVIEPKMMWEDLSEEKIRETLNVDMMLPHVQWNPLAMPSKGVIAYVSALQGVHSELFASCFSRTVETHKRLFPDEAEPKNHYADLFEWWRRYLLDQNTIMILPFPLGSAGKPFLTPPNKRYVQQTGNLYLYSTGNKNMQLPVKVSK